MSPPNIQRVVARLSDEARRQAVVMEAAIRLEIGRGLLASEADTRTSSIFDRVKQEPRGSIKALTGFEDQEFDELFATVESAFLASRTARGRGSKLTFKDRLLIFLIYLKHYETYAKMGSDFGFTSSGMQEVIMKTARILRPKLTELFVVPLRKWQQVQAGMFFPRFPSVALVVDCSVQPIYRPIGPFQEAKAFYSGKHGAYVVKREYAHLPDGRFAFASQVFSGAVHDTTIFNHQLPIYQEFLQKVDRDANLPDERGMLSWALMADKGYQGIQDRIRAVIPLRRDMMLDQTNNAEIAIERIICENAYGRLKTLFGICSHTFWGSLEQFLLFNDICIALTNYHITIHPLRINDLYSYSVIKRDCR
jgi:hypothetical protein